MSNEPKNCFLCGEPIEGTGNNPEPLGDFAIDGPCCNYCDNAVTNARIRRHTKYKECPESLFSNVLCGLIGLTGNFLSEDITPQQRENFIRQWNLNHAYISEFFDMLGARIAEPELTEETRETKWQELQELVQRLRDAQWKYLEENEGSDV